MKIKIDLEDVKTVNDALRDVVTFYIAAKIPVPVSVVRAVEAINDTLHRAL
jgi:hypothetical protein